MAELRPVLVRLRDEQHEWLKARPEGISEALRAVLDDAMVNGTWTGTLLEERRAFVAGDNLTFTEFVQLHILPRKRDHRLSYIRSPAMADILQNFGRTRSELQAEVLRLEPTVKPAPPSPPITIPATEGEGGQPNADNETG